MGEALLGVQHIAEALFSQEGQEGASRAERQIPILGLGA